MLLKELALENGLLIRELPASQLEDASPIISQFRPYLTREDYIAIAGDMIKNGYKIACMYHASEMIAYAGFAENLNLHYGRHIWVYDLVVDEKCRSKGYGGIMLQYIEDIATENQIKSVALSSGLQRLQAHNFYENKAGYDKVSFVYKKELAQKDNH